MGLGDRVPEGASVKLANLTTAAVVGRWIYYRRAYGWWRAELRRGYVQAEHPGQIVALVLEVGTKPGFPRRPINNPHPLLLPLDELEIHAVVETAPEPATEAPSA